MGVELGPGGREGREGTDCRGLEAFLYVRWDGHTIACTRKADSTGGDIPVNRPKQ